MKLLPIEEECSAVIILSINNKNIGKQVTVIKQRDIFTINTGNRERLWNIEGDLVDESGSKFGIFWIEETSLMRIDGYDESTEKSESKELVR